MRSITVALCLFASISFAQTEPAPAPKNVQKADFTPQDINGKRGSPIGDIYGPPLRKKFDCLITVRVNFNDKLQESVHEM